MFAGDQSPFAFFDGIFCLNLDSQVERWEQAARRHRQLGMSSLVERFSAVATPENHHRGCALSFRRMIALASQRGYERVLILEDDAVFIDETTALMTQAAQELAGLDWDLLFLGACVWSQDFPYLAGSAVIQECGPVTGGHAFAVHRRAFAKVLSDIPSHGELFERWFEEYLAKDQFLSRRIADGTFRALITSPRVASQPPLLSYASADLALAGRYVI